ncbi:hypothetical protein, partial [Escherichia coli]|uniref:hypothetical protein n=1 Tax=Escherichia coli TaxID=562 RepID=UPI0019D4738A
YAPNPVPCLCLVYTRSFSGSPEYPYYNFQLMLRPKGTGQTRQRESPPKRAIFRQTYLSLAYSLLVVSLLDR